MHVLVRRLRPWLVAGGDALLATALTVAVCWLILRSLTGGAAGPVGAYLSGDLTGLAAAAVAASTGAPLDWSCRTGRARSGRTRGSWLSRSG
ncbi:hypothetical protein [Micromonospora sp. NPDC050200]|uniref:hypothetical protein n=1 Tax=Micromonospora sp. NPDC050200 TaxID=3155664 RepID=UPI003404F9EA